MTASSRLGDRGGEGGEGEGGGGGAGPKVVTASLVVETTWDWPVVVGTG